MDKEFLNYEQSLALKKLGFDEPSLGRFYTKSRSKMFGRDEKGRHYPIINTPKKLYALGEHFVLNEDNVITAPLKQQAFRFFREKYNILVNVYANASGFLYQWEDAVGGTHRGFSDFEGPNDSGVWDSYEEAELACIDKLIELVKEANNEQ